MSLEQESANEGGFARWHEVSRVVSPDAVTIGAVALVVLTGLDVLNAIVISGSSGLLVLAGYLYRLRAAHGQRPTRREPPTRGCRVPGCALTNEPESVHGEGEANPPPPQGSHLGDGERKNAAGTEPLTPPPPSPSESPKPDPA